MTLLHDLIHDSAHATPDGIALIYGEQRLSYAALSIKVRAMATVLCARGLKRGERVGIYLEKRPETVIACFGATNAGATFVPINPLLKADQVAYILRDCDVRMLITSKERLGLIRTALAQCPSLREVALVDGFPAGDFDIDMLAWEDMVKGDQGDTHRIIDADMAAILYTSGSTGRPKGVVLSHRNMVAGARSVASYLQNHRDDTLLAALPLSFDAGFSQLSTAFHAQATVALINYLLPRDVLHAVVRERVTGLTAVPPLWIQLSQLEWPKTVDHPPALYS
jgi:acyl-CoA synthetase (AMP-forming)/AMP-acid ligase II